MPTCRRSATANYLPIFSRFESTTITGTDPDGSKYSDRHALETAR
ncbi:MAG TPA: hypothetical protein VHU13_05825 [Solirubrobacteraceae bacterium]|jgi:hypothetical protein|nr:hypothetical protein [Solirubrobacteraceae bacterium]